LSQIVIWHGVCKAKAKANPKGPKNQVLDSLSNQALASLQNQGFSLDIFKLLIPIIKMYFSKNQYLRSAFEKSYPQGNLLISKDSGGVINWIDCYFFKQPCVSHPHFIRDPRKKARITGAIQVQVRAHPHKKPPLALSNEPIRTKNRHSQSKKARMAVFVYVSGAKTATRAKRKTRVA